ADDDVILRIGDPRQYVYGSVTYVISYTIGNAMVDAGDRQEIYLDINGTGWLQPFDRVTATLDVSQIADHLLGEQACYFGAAGSTARCRIEQRGTRFHAETTNLGPRQSMTIAVGFLPGTVSTAIPLPRQPGFGWAGLLAMPGLGVLCLAFALGMRTLRRRIGSTREVVTRFEPPAGIPPIAAADFLGRPETGAAAQLADLVVSGLATITTEGEPIATAAQDRGRLGRRPTAELRSRLTVFLHRPRKIESGTLRAICTDLFGEGKPVSLDRVRRGGIADATRRRRDLQELLDLRGAVVAPGPMLTFGMVALVAWGWAQLALGIPGLAWPFLGLGLLGVLLLVAAVHYYPTVGRLTKHGRQVRDQLAGLHAFVTMAEAGRISWLQNAVDAPRISGPDDSGTLVKLYEPLLPYAIIFGVEQTWQQLLGSLFEPPGQDDDAGAATRRAASWAGLAGDAPRVRLYDEQDDRTSSWWNSRPAWGEGWVASAGESIARSWDERRSSRDDDYGGSSWSSGGSSSSWSSSSDSSSGSSGGGSSGGGMGGGGGGGW
ncbi:MAG: DUF2207 domain-containing protein, partial [Propionibacteriaceae bacterium]|nr:DUF2207 domain-containing protein [Propionibacteriaceae bacterium]